jgi:hypothetical protein
MRSTGGAIVSRSDDGCSGRCRCGGRGPTGVSQLVSVEDLPVEEYSGDER